MLKRLTFAAAALGLLAAPAVQAEDAVEMTRGEAKLQKMLEGRVAGEAEKCIRTSGSLSIISVDDTALVYRSGDTLWVNYTKSPQSIDDDDILVIERFSSGSLCRSDRIETYSRGGNFWTGVIFLGDFVPYRKIEDGAS